MHSRMCRSPLAAGTKSIFCCPTVKKTVVSPPCTTCLFLIALWGRSLLQTQRLSEGRWLTPATYCGETCPHYCPSSIPAKTFECFTVKNAVLLVLELKGEKDKPNVPINLIPRCYWKEKQHLSLMLHMINAGASCLGDLGASITVPCFSPFLCFFAPSQTCPTASLTFAKDTD